MTDQEETKTFHIDYLNGNYPDWDSVESKFALAYTIKLTRKQYELMKLCKFNADRTNNRTFNMAVAEAFIEAMETMYEAIKQSVD